LRSRFADCESRNIHRAVELLGNAEVASLARSGVALAAANIEKTG